MKKSRKIKLTALKDVKEVCFIHNNYYLKSLPVRTCTAKSFEKIRKAR